jgi:hypothetical protein
MVGTPGCLQLDAIKGPTARLAQRPWVEQASYPTYLAMMVLESVTQRRTFVDLNTTTQLILQWTTNTAHI